MGDHTYVRFVRSEADLADPTKLQAAIYLHWGGDATYMREVFNEFFEAVESDCVNDDFRYGDPDYLAAKFVVHLAREMGDDAERPLSFLSVGVTAVSVFDAVTAGAYTFAVVCNRGTRSKLRPRLMVDETLSEAGGAIAYHSMEDLDEVIAAQRENEEVDDA
jgi:hypothetical protein